MGRSHFPPSRTQVRCKRISVEVPYSSTADGQSQRRGLGWNTSGALRLPASGHPVQYRRLDQPAESRTRARFFAPPRKRRRSQTESWDFIGPSLSGNPCPWGASSPMSRPAERTRSGTQALAVHGVFVTIFSSTSQQWLMTGCLRTARRALPKSIHDGHPCRAVAVDGGPGAGRADSPRGLQDCLSARPGEYVAVVL